jgi:hypothetical protein
MDWRPTKALTTCESTDGFCIALVMKTLHQQATDLVQASWGPLLKISYVADQSLAIIYWKERYDDSTTHARTGSWWSTLDTIQCVLILIDSNVHAGGEVAEEVCACLTIVLVGDALQIHHQPSLVHVDGRPAHFSIVCHEHCRIHMLPCYVGVDCLCLKSSHCDSWSQSLESISMEDILLEAIGLHSAMRLSQLQAIIMARTQVLQISRAEYVHAQSEPPSRTRAHLLPISYMCMMHAAFALWTKQFWISICTINTASQ